MTTSRRVSESTRARVASLAAQTGTSLGSVVETAVNEYERLLFWRWTAEALAAADCLPPGADDELWDRTTADGLRS